MVCYKKLRVESYDLQKPEVLNYYINQGFMYVTRIYPNRPSKFPTIGCIVELSHYRQHGSHPIHSVEGQQLIQRLT
jgi:hypothetical protein